MLLFYFDFLCVYYFLCTISLVKDLFIPSLNVINSSPSDVVSNYRSMFFNNKELLFQKAIPFFIFFEAFYYINSEPNYLHTLFQLPMYFYIGFVIHCCSIKILESYTSYEFNTYNKRILHNNVFMTFNITPVEFYLVYILPFLSFPMIFGMNQLAINIMFYLGLWVMCMNNSNDEGFEYMISSSYSILKLDVIEKFCNTVVEKLSNFHDNNIYPANIDIKDNYTVLDDNELDNVKESDVNNEDDNLNSNEVEETLVKAAESDDNLNNNEVEETLVNEVFENENIDNTSEVQEVNDSNTISDEDFNNSLQEKLNSEEKTKED